MSPGTASRAADAVLTVAVAVSAVAFMAVADQPEARPADLIGGILLAGASLPLLARRRWPIPALVATIVVSLGYLSLQYPGGAELPLLMLGFYSAAATGHRWPTLVILGGWLVVGFLYRLVVDQQNPIPVVMTAVLLGLVYLLGDLVHTRCRLRWEIGERLRAVTAEQQLETERRLTEERLRIAHELHDVMAHTITTMTVQAGAAADMLPHRPNQAGDLLRQLRKTARDAMAELRATITVLRGDGGEAPRRPAPRLRQLEALIRSVEAAGVSVDTADCDELPELPSTVELTAYRVIQEALTNVIRHARVDRARVRLQRNRFTLTVSIEDDGVGPRSGHEGEGHGLVGLRERVHAVGGTLSVGPLPDRGFSVRAVLPLEGNHP